MSARRGPLPLTVIGGFLGAGKTTLLARILRESRGQRLAVLVNDFGALNIDAELVVAKDGDMIALTNGCACCSIGDDLTDALIRVLAAPAPFDAVVIEASGISDPWRIAQVGLADPGLSLDGVIVLVDAATVLEQAADPLLADSLRRQLKAADLVVINKADLVDAGRLEQVRDWVAGAVPDAPTFVARRANVPLALISGAAMPVPPDTDAVGGPGSGSEVAEWSAHRGHEGGHGGHAHGSDGHDLGDPAHGAVFETWSCRPQRMLPAQALRDWLRSRPTGVLRLKGLVRTDEHGWAEVQFAGRRGSLRRARNEPRGEAAVVAIGLRGCLPTGALQRLFDDARAA
ncbi:MAG: GTP-binding protein [Lautropia sp.]|nr:MAG: GTP-binding protein [Pseudomonadota bacterium]MBC6959343.1 GTP-binding protein [Lautropia sp.]MCL4701249.1 GTP-binding protein [Burkholderiaceae bacterium]MDL1907391.1 GTP-binding protein [Betaproteobacteria bacterium PRO1]RIK90009.1 MAG: cobalamin biosynthesis protein P47K [Burkholderiales bacterium]